MRQGSYQIQHIILSLLEQYRTQYNTQYNTMNVLELLIMAACSPQHTGLARAACVTSFSLVCASVFVCVCVNTRPTAFTVKLSSTLTPAVMTGLLFSSKKKLCSSYTACSIKLSEFNSNNNIINNNALVSYSTFSLGTQSALH